MNKIIGLDPVGYGKWTVERLTALVQGKSTHLAGRINRLMTSGMPRKAMSRLMGRMMAEMFDIKVKRSTGHPS